MSCEGRGGKFIVKEVIDGETDFGEFVVVTFSRSKSLRLDKEAQLETQDLHKSFLLLQLELMVTKLVVLVKFLVDKSEIEEDEDLKDLHVGLEIGYFGGL
jgi:hypothetical protein